MRWLWTIVALSLSSTAGAQETLETEDAGEEAPATTGTRGTYPLPGEPTASVSGDFNGDGRADVATTTAGGLVVHLRTWAGTFQAVASPSISGFLAAADFNRDGRLDLVSTAATADVPCGIVVHAGRGDGTFTSGPFVPFVHRVEGAGAPPNYWRLFCKSVRTGDFNRDGNPDVALAFGIQGRAFPASISGSFDVFFGNGAGGFGTPYTPDDEQPFWTHVMLATDLNGDRATDLVFGDTERHLSGARANRVTAFLSNGSGGFTQSYDVDVTATTGNAVFEAISGGDFNGDGKADVALVLEMFGAGIPAGEPRPLTVLLGNGDGTFGAATAVGTTRGAQDVTAADFNGDRRQDLAVISDSSGTLSVFYGRGNGTFGPPSDLTLGGPLFSVLAGHFDLDRRVDLVITSRNPAILTLLRNTGCERRFTLADVHRFPWPWRCFMGGW